MITFQYFFLHLQYELWSILLLCFIFHTSLCRRKPSVFTVLFLCQISSMVAIKHDFVAASWAVMAPWLIGAASEWAMMGPLLSPLWAHSPNQSYIILHAENHLKLQSRKILFSQNLVLCRFEILHRARQWYCRALCKISKRFSKWNVCWGRFWNKFCKF